MDNKSSYRGGNRGDHGASGRPGGYSSPGPSRARGPRFQRDDRDARGGERSGRGRDSRGRVRGGVFMADQRAAVDERIANNSDKKLVASFGTECKLGLDDMPLRPNFGTEGREVTLRVNYFPVYIPKGPLYEYDVEISPAANHLSRHLKRRIYQLAEQTIAWKQAGLSGTVAHDNSSKLVANHILPQPLAIPVPYYDEDEQGPPIAGGKEYYLTIKLIQEIDTNRIMSYIKGKPEYRGHDIQSIISALNLILATGPDRRGVVVGGNKFFFRAARDPTPIGGGLEAWKGFYSSVRPVHKQLMVNVNVCTTAFYVAQNLAIAMSEFRSASFGAYMNDWIRGVRVMMTHLGRRGTIKEVVGVDARQHRFHAGELGEVSVEQYFKRKYNITLKHPKLPLVNIGGGQTKGNQREKKERKSLLPPELCEILPNQPFLGELTKDHTANMITVACNPPNANGEAIVHQGLTHLGFRAPGPLLEAFGIKIGSDMTVVSGRILSMPSIKYSQDISPSVNVGASWNMKDVKFAVGAALDKMAVLVIKDGIPEAQFAGCRDPELRSAVSTFRDMCVKSGMQVTGEPLYLEVNLPCRTPADPMRMAAIDAIRKVLHPQLAKIGIVMVMLPSEDKLIYQGLKHLCDVHLGVASVCVQSTNIKDRNPQYCANVALKFNAKLGGINHTLDEDSSEWLNAKPTMIVGMDVTHPGFGAAGGAPSIAAVVATFDNLYTQYPGSLEIQERREEIISSLENMMIERLELYKKKNKERLPERILVYRDGVSEGQFKLVREKELPQMVKAFKKFDKVGKPYKPKLTIVICGKRHHTRFYPTTANGATKDGNPLPGTVVDRGVTAVYDFDFFLQAHGSSQGTARPTHYYVVHDEIGFDANTLQGLTNSLSYMFSRATKAVSLVSPAYYADIACWRGRCYLRQLLRHRGSNGEEDGMKKAKELWHGGVHRNLKDTMFYL
ncbi:Piwi domain-containing protein [Scleroderma yunnanense]